VYVCYPVGVMKAVSWLGWLVAFQLVLFQVHLTIFPHPAVRKNPGNLAKGAEKGGSHWHFARKVCHRLQQLTCILSNFTTMCLCVTGRGILMMLEPHILHFDGCQANTNAPIPAHPSKHWVPKVRPQRMTEKGNYFSEALSEICLPARPAKPKNLKV